MPTLSENMIAVYYDEEDDTWRKADSENKNPKYKWYDYCDKMWANSVTVGSTNRSAYLSADLGTEIPMEDILTMQVWIPRYKYTIWNYNLNGTVTSEPQEIDIQFEEGKISTGEISCRDTISGTDGANSESCEIKTTNEECTDDTCNGKTYTHPAFTFGEDELEGFWVGKFEVSSDTNCTTTKDVGVGLGCNLTSIRPQVKPNVISWRGAMIGTFDNDIRLMNEARNKYGFAATDDTHVIKNIEWGAVSYLSHSKYGTCTNGECTEVAPNSANTYTTGCGPQSKGNTSSGSICNTYNTTLGQSASTTENIYGIYDMSGGLNEVVMGNIVSPDGKTMICGNRSTSNYPNEHSGYSGMLYHGGQNTPYTGTYEYPNNKYYDKYSFGSSDSQKNRAKLGDGIKEVTIDSNLNWYSVQGEIIATINAWYTRGGFVDFSNNGLFRSTGTYGQAYTNRGTRIVISQPN